MRAGLALLAAVTVVVAGCGGGGGGGTPAAVGDAAALVPADAVAYAAIDTDRGSPQLRSASAILDRFPFEAKLLEAVRSALVPGRLDLGALSSTVGPELDVAELGVNGRTEVVAFTQPKDEKGFDARLDGGSPPVVHTTLDGWTVFASRPALLAAVENRKASLADAPAFRAAMNTLPDAAVARAYVTGAGAQTALTQVGGGLRLGKWAAVALTSQDGALKLEVHAKGAAVQAPSGPGLADQIPSHSLLALSLTGGGRAVPSSLTKQASSYARRAGFDLGGLVEALQGPVIAYVRAGDPVPEVTVVAKPPHPKRTVAAVGRLVTKLAKGIAAPVPAQVGDATLEKVDLGSVQIYYGSVRGEVAVTDDANAVAELHGSLGRLAEDPIFKEAKDGAGMPDATAGFLFLDLKNALPVLSGLARLANQKLPAGVEASLRPLRSVLVYASTDSDVQSLVAYLKTS